MTLLTLTGWSLTTGGEIRYIGSVPPDFVLDAESTAVGQGPVLDQRLRAGVEARGETWSLGTSWDLFAGQLAGDTWDVPGSIDARHREDLGVLDAGSFVPRRAALEARLGVVGVQAGLVTSHWGLGMLANDGARDPEFGRSDFGDRVLRLRVGTRPLRDVPLTIALAGDRVVEDELAALSEGQVAWQGVLAALWSPESGDRLGLYGVWRDQTEADGERVTRVAVADLYGELVRPVGGEQLRAGVELAGVTGHTSRARTYELPEGVAVRSAGAFGFVGVQNERLGARLRGGWASGDGDPDDAVSNDFAFDRDLDAGMLLFDEYSAAIEANTYAQLADPENSGAPPDGADALVTEGALRRAAFVQPVVELRPTAWLELRAGVLSGFATSPIANPFTSYRSGGVPTNHLGEATEGYGLGTEVDWAVRIAFAPKEAKLRPDLLVQGAHLWASEDMGGQVGTLLTATARARW